MTHILLVEDDSAIVNTLTDLLRSDGFAVTSTPTQDEALTLLNQQTYDLALLDITLKQGNGFAVCAAIKARLPEMPVIFLTASDDEYSTVAGLDMGADDYIAKPFRARELLSRIHVALRRKNEHKAVITLGNLEIDTTAALVHKDGADITLSALEYKLLLLFAQNQGKLISRDALRNVIWESASEYVSDNTINVYINRLRNKIEDDPAEPKLIQTIRGLGYKTIVITKE